MRIDSISLADKNPLIADYKYHFSKVQDKFDYHPHGENTWLDRLNHIESTSYDRDLLVDELIRMNDQYGAGEATFTNINKLKDKRASVVVGGQQAGLLTGPLYTVHKIISILQLSRQKEKEVGAPVVPIFWIAGEDHDFAEINHIFMKKNGNMEKIQADTDVNEKSSVSDLPFNQKDIQQWLTSVFHELNETEHSVDLLHRLESMLRTSNSYSDFFAKLVHQLFPSEGLILLDAHDQEIRKLESQFFLKMIDENQVIAEGVHSLEQKNKQQGYPLSLDSEMDDAHLFYHHEGERVLLIRDENGDFKGKKEEVSLTKEQLRSIAEKKPWLLSNNVVTRPLMQECLLPVLAFVGGPGEISYWSALKPGFEALQLKMPPVVPRLSFTMVDRKSEQHMQRLQLDEKEVIEHGTASKKLAWLASTGTPPIRDLSKEVKKEMEMIHQPLREKAAQLSPDVAALAQKNWEYIEQSVEFLEKRMMQSIENQYQDQLEVFDELHVLLHPNGGFQERVWSVLPWLNAYGISLFEQLNSHDLSFEHTHYLVKV
ncbi:putative cysteine ligase BshC [Halobacillus andaensis]|uniref:Putative cysteine ligase BshC n=1 Tax=Halobacillus andaensis TaxID=1176239 RepID=A0A917B065_HALAA|nr:bacillithiol biosynthesis cysteine-adding enzyme BshC [Halobacillus andaensis]MBP2003594.1 bacillithiol biosynthesis cysteine-adding enzyme BshC [Halobacillus andaensis]GGF11811.1 putative cysteine ligase BshC [Halobacillus andaensis]